MDISYFDRYSHLDSPLHRLDSRTKILSSFLIVLAAVATPADFHFSFIGYFVLIGMGIRFSQIPPVYVFSRVLAAAPFLGMALVFSLLGGIQNGGTKFLEILLRSSLAILALTLLSMSTPIPKLLCGFEQLRVPKLFVTLLGVTFRYLVVLAQELGRMKRAGDSRGFGGRWIWRAGVIGNFIGTLFLRSLDRADRISQAMVSRGFDGTFPGRPAGKWESRDFRILGFLGLSLFLLGAGPVLFP